jgi:predicted membrane GTPase involved in stress response
MKNLEDEKKDLTPLFDEILNFVPVAKDNSDKPFRMQIANL